jgi:hypothetical protein
MFGVAPFPFVIRALFPAREQGNREAPYLDDPFSD